MVMYGECENLQKRRKMGRGKGVGRDDMKFNINHV